MGGTTMKDRSDKDKKKDLLERFSRLSYSKNDWIQERKDKMMEEDGRAHVRIDLSSTDAINPFSGGTRLDQAVFDYVENEAMYTDVDELLSIDFIVKEKNEEYDRMLAKEVKNHYLFKFAETKEKKREVLRKSFGLLGAGILFVILYIIMSFLSNSIDTSISTNGRMWLSIFSEVVDIIYWVFIWEAVDKFFFEQREVQKELLRLTQLATSDINIIQSKK